MSDPYFLPDNTSFEVDCAVLISALMNALNAADATVQGYSAIDHGSPTYVVCNVFATDTTYTITIIRQNRHVQLTYGPKKRPNVQISPERNLDIVALLEQNALVDEV